jgi:phosphate transport system permease protein
MSTAEKLLGIKTLNETRAAKFAGRKRVNQIALTLSVAAMAFGVFWLMWILWETLRLGIGGLAIRRRTRRAASPTRSSAPS